MTMPRLPYAKDHDRSIENGMAKGIAPKGLPALLRWYEAAWAAETPMTIHRAGLWADGGGSILGAPAWSDPFRRYLQGSPSATDRDGYYRLPIHAALSRLSRSWPLMSRSLFTLATHGFDWRAVADLGHWPVEMFQVYIEQALHRLWREHAVRVD